MTVYGLADRRLADSELGEVIEMFVHLRDAELAIDSVVTDEPSWANELRLVQVELDV